MELVAAGQDTHFSVTNLGNWLGDVSGNWWFLGVILIIALVDAVIPAVPSETCVIIGGVAAGLGEQSLLLVIPCAAVGAFLGDNLSYLIGRLFSALLYRRAKTKPKFGQRLDWASRQIHERGGMLLITARFIPGGRTVITLCSGVTRQSRAWFAGWIAVAAIIWASYAALLGYVGGKAFEDNHTAAFLLAFGGALAVTGTIELVRYLRHRKRPATV